MVGDIIRARFRTTNTHRITHVGEEWVSHCLQESLDRRRVEGLLGNAGIRDGLPVLSALPDS